MSPRIRRNSPWGTTICVCNRVRSLVSGIFLLGQLLLLRLILFLDAVGLFGHTIPPLFDTLALGRRVFQQLLAQFVGLTLRVLAGLILLTEQRGVLLLHLIPSGLKRFLTRGIKRASSFF